MPAGEWQRPAYYALPDKSTAEAIAEEVTAVRRRVGVIDVGTLGKLEISVSLATLLVTEPAASVAIKT